MEIDNKRYIVAILLAVSTFNFLDHQILALLMQPIKEDMSLSDSQLGFLSGIAFVIFYCTLGIPIARWADRGNRITIISLSVVIFSGMTALFGMATNFWQLLLCRIGVGIGEAGTTPPSHSLIADHFTAKERPQAMAFFMMGAPLGVVLGFFFAGWINELYGWRTAFFALGLPGVLLGLLVKLSLKDPREDRGKNIGSTIEIGNQSEAEIPPSFTATLAILWQQKTYRYLLVALSLAYFIGYGLGQWIPAFFMRTHGLKSGELGTCLAVISIFGAAATWLGGYLTTRFWANDERQQLRLIAMVVVFANVITAFAYLQSDKYAALAIIGLSQFFGYMVLGPVYSIVQGLAPHKMRATAVAILYLVINFIGMGLGPLGVGILSDLLAPLLGEESLRFSMLSMLPLTIFAGLALWRASDSVKKNLAHAESYDMKIAEKNEKINVAKASHIDTTDIQII